MKSLIWMRNNSNWVFIGLSYILSGIIVYFYFRDHVKDTRLIIPSFIIWVTVTTLYHIYLAKRMEKLLDKIKDFANFTFNKMVKR